MIVKIEMLYHLALARDNRAKEFIQYTKNIDLLGLSILIHGIILVIGVIIL